MSQHVAVGRTGVTAASGFEAAGVAAGLKATGALDLAVVRNLGPRFEAAAVFTTNRVFAAPVGWSRAALADRRLVAVVLNSGGANAGTGAAGRDDAAQTAAAAADHLGCLPMDVGLCSTGLIGARLPMPQLLAGVAEAVGRLGTGGGAAAAEAIMTTDTRPKTAVRTGPEGYTVGGMAKGAGMLAPGLATMLAVVTTDAEVERTELDEALRQATRTTLERADSDGCMSTNDTVIAMASGASRVHPPLTSLVTTLTEVCEDLARQLIADAEGAEHEIAVEVVGAATEADALEVARTVARSNLFKCAIAGNDPNWGRVLAAVGTTQAAFAPDEIDVYLNGVPVCQQSSIGADPAQVDLRPRQVQVRIDLHAGSEAATIWTNDLTHGYVSENADYSS
ncbi:MAG: bifunctional glutamate N-acetyltransferase/amino-acid acetyltransferase ArgJ [Actinomycetia bacterium]|nr:bifunctional glutamate N-acetyltransferase/amino-acid acetyltransferase ArgJ [Actinomycetes bacterium]